MDKATPHESLDIKSHRSDHEMSSQQPSLSHIQHQHQLTPPSLDATASSSPSVSSTSSIMSNNEMTAEIENLTEMISLKNNKSAPVFPWFGIDVGGTLVKLVYFEPLDLTSEEEKKEGELLKTIRHYLTSHIAYGDTGFRDAHLELKSRKIGDRLGNLHFIRFPSSRMESFIELCVSRKLHTLTFQVYATGGGAFKFEKFVKERLKIGWHKCDELDMLIQGVEMLTQMQTQVDPSQPNTECYYLEMSEDSVDSLNQSSSSDSGRSRQLSSSMDQASETSDHRTYIGNASKSIYIKKHFDFTNPYPYIVVNIGSGVSILLVTSETNYKRISGSSLGGGTFLGLCCLLTGCNTYEEAIELASRGDNTKVDKLVRDIYGNDYSRFNLPGNVIASSFGHMNNEEKRVQATREDLARSTLVTVLNNIGLLARDCANNYKCERVLFVGSFLRINDLSMQLISYATNYWSKGKIKALFLEHEGYYGAIGCLKNFIHI